MKTAEDFFNKAVTYERAGHLAHALEIFEKIAAANPHHLGVLKKVAALSAKLGRDNAAEEAYRRIPLITRDPIEVTMAAIGLANILFESDPTQAIAVLKRDLTPEQPAVYAERLNTLVRMTEWKARQDRGLPVHHALSLDEIPFSFARAETAEYIRAVEQARTLNPSVLGWALMAVGARVLAGDFPGANTMAQNYERLAPQDSRGTMRFGAAARPQPVVLPPTTIVREITHRGPIFMVSCDAVYLRHFALPQLRSLAAVAPGASVHVHLMAESAAPLAAFDDLPLTMSSTIEDPRAFIARYQMLPAGYYCAARFVRFAEMLERTSVPVWMADADSLIVNDPRPLFATSADAAVRVRAGRVEPWNHFSACLVMGTPAARAYYREVANVVLATMTRPWWGLDQFALYAAYLTLKDKLPSFHLLGPEAVSIDFDPASTFWFTAGLAKNALLNGTPASHE